MVFSLLISFVLTGSTPSRRACPFVGVWTAGEGECGREVTHLRAGCSALYALKFVHACATQTTKHCELNDMFVKIEIKVKKRIIIHPFIQFTIKL